MATRDGSIGFAFLVPTRAEERGELIKLADSALYLAKSRGRNRVETVASLERLEAADITSSAKLRILRILGRDGTQGPGTLAAAAQRPKSEVPLDRPSG